MNTTRISIGLACTALLASTLLTAAGPASAAMSENHVTCAGDELTIRTNGSNGGNGNGGWSSVQVVSASGHLTPLSFSGSLLDTTIGQVIYTFAQQKGGGNADANRTPTTCTQEMTGTLADFLGGDPLPPGASLTDNVILDFTAIVVRKA
jgi:hypothetical protein